MGTAESARASWEADCWPAAGGGTAADSACVASAAGRGDKSGWITGLVTVCDINSWGCEVATGRGAMLAAHAQDGACAGAALAAGDIAELGSLGVCCGDCRGESSGVMQGEAEGAKAAGPTGTAENPAEAKPGCCGATWQAAAANGSIPLGLKTGCGGGSTMAAGGTVLAWHPLGDMIGGLGDRCC